MENSLVHAAKWLVFAVLLGAAFLYLGSDRGGAAFMVLLLGPSGPIMATSFGFKIIAATMASAALRITLKGFDVAVGLNFKEVVKDTKGASYAYPILLYAGLRYIGIGLMFGFIFSS